jgi:hypothetical protein
MKILDSLRASLSKDKAVAITPATAPDNKIARKKLLKRKVKPCTEDSRQEVIEQIRNVVHDKGYKVIRVSNLLNCFGFQKRSSSNVELITAILAEHNLTVHPQLSLGLKSADCLRIYGFPVAQLGDLFESEEQVKTQGARQQRERELEEFIDKHDLFYKLGLKKVERQYSPKQTRDKFDFLCSDAKGNRVVLELKHVGGGKSAVEQVLRYIGMLKQEQPGNKARGILITGIRDVDTAKALHGMTPAQQQEIEWYLYRYSKGSGDVNFELVTYDFIEHHLGILNKAS